MHLSLVFLGNCAKKAIPCLKIFCCIGTLDGFQRGSAQKNLFILQKEIHKFLRE